MMNDGDDDATTDRLLATYADTQRLKRARLQRALDVHDDAARRAYLQKTRLLDRINAVAYADGSDGSGDERDGADDVDANERASDTASTTTSEILSWLPTDHPLRARLPGGVQDARAWIEERLDVHYRMLPAMAGAQLLPPVASSGRRGGGGATTSISGPSVSTHGNILRIRAVFGSAAAATADRASSSMSTSSAHMDDATGATATASGSTQRYSRKTPDHRIRKHKPIPPPQADGTFTVPAKYGPVTVVKLGAIAAAMNEIEDVGGYDTERYIYPVGYTTTRRFLSTLNADDDQCLYTSKISRGENGPCFEVIAGDSSGIHTQARSASGAWAPIITAAYEIRPGRKPATVICGPDLFGLTCPEIAKLVQELPGASACPRYKTQTFIKID